MVTNEEYLASLREASSRDLLIDILEAPMPGTCPACGRCICTVYRTTNRDDDIVTENRRCVVCRNKWVTTRKRFE